MDKPETYIKMSDCPEIQEDWKPQIGDWFYKEDGIGYGLWLICQVSAPNGETLWCSGERMNQPPFEGKLVQFTAPENYIWLPLQSQLQEMIGEEYSINLLYAFHRFYNTMGCDLYPHTINGAKTSMEQLWLTFVMKEKYNKTWYGEDWVNP